MNKILSIKEIVPNVHELIIEAPEIAAKAKPGQFAIVIPDDVGERIPINIADWSIRDGTVTMYFLEVGVSTMKLARKKAGESIDFVGPLGKPATIGQYGTVFIGGGCYGIGAIYPIVKALKEAGNRVITVIEARSDYLLYNQKRLRKCSDKFIITTSDGSVGKKGKVKSMLSTLVENGEKIDMAYFVGCTFMMMISSLEANDYGIKSFVYLNPLMVDATGMCGVCRVSVGGKTKFACVDGPEFSGELVDWEELFNRKNQYTLQESLAFHHKCRFGREVR